MDYKELKNLGLAEKEAKVYLAALELEQSTVQKISEKAKVNRATTYVVIEALIQKGLMSSVHEDKKQFFYAESPEKLNLLFREQARDIQRKQEYLDKILPNLKALSRFRKKGPVVRYFEGKDGLKSMSEEFYLTPQKERARMFYSLDLIKNIFSDDELKNFTQRRIEKNVKTEVIYSSKKDERKTTADGNRYRVDEKDYPIYCDIAIYSDKVRIASLKNDLVGLIIEDKNISESLKSIFQLALIGVKSLSK